MAHCENGNRINSPQWYPHELVGKLLIVLDNCRQWALDPETELILNANPY